MPGLTPNSFGANTTSISRGDFMTAKALCVGINKFAHLPQASWLNGCVNDAMDMAAFLETRPEFSGGHIKILKDTAATKAKVMAALKDIIADEDVDHIV